MKKLLLISISFFYSLSANAEIDCYTDFLGTRCTKIEPLTGFMPDPSSFWDMSSVDRPHLDFLKRQQADLLYYQKKTDDMMRELDPTNLLKNLDNSNLSSSASKQNELLEEFLEIERKRQELEQKKFEAEQRRLAQEKEEKEKKAYEDALKRLSGDTEKTEQQEKIERLERLIEAQERAIKKLENEKSSANLK